jgi:predicted Zn-dependent protease
VIARRPDDAQLVGARAAAFLEAGRVDEALADLDKVVDADADPKWRRLRARARSKHGDAAGAKLDRQRACELGDAPACHEL